VRACVRVRACVCVPVYSPQWKQGGRSEGGGSCDGCRTYRNTLRRAAAAKVRALPSRAVEAVKMGSAAEMEQEEAEVAAAAAGVVVEDHYGEDSATEELPILPWAFSVAR
jgi:malate dehydrogenase (oxaloacetate-decarboxylating)(NADP+)